MQIYVLQDTNLRIWVRRFKFHCSSITRIAVAPFPERKLDYVLGLKEFCDSLGEKFNYMKVTVLYHILDFKRTYEKEERLAYPKELFLEYIRIPRRLPFSNDEFL